MRLVETYHVICLNQSHALFGTSLTQCRSTLLYICNINDNNNKLKAHHKIMKDYLKKTQEDHLQLTTHPRSYPSNKKVTDNY